MLALCLLAACTNVPVDERAAVRQEINDALDTTLEALTTTDPKFQKEIDTSVGYFASRVSATKIPVVGGGYGIGVLFDKEQNSRTYMNITRFDVGAGLGAGRFRVLILFENRETLERFRRGTWSPGLGVETAAGSRETGRYSMGGDGYSLHFSTEFGAAISLSARLIRLSVNRDLTNTGISELSLPNTGFDGVDDQGDYAPRVWDRKLPFLAQKVVDEGYDLPLPYGLGLVYAHIEQQQLLRNLEVGINGNPKEPFEFVAFENAFSNSDTVSVKADAWLFPFMNVFVNIGRVDGGAPMDVILDGNGMLDQLGVDCGSLPPSPLCPVLEDQTFVLPITAPFTGTSYSLGATLAGGWNGWFVAIPFTATNYVPSNNSTDGDIFTASPRAGRVINLGRKGNLALFAGANYLDSNVIAEGNVSTPDGLLSIDYTIDQENKDKWNAVVGFNWDINRKLSWSAEYNGWTGSRDAFISTLGWRF
jgi:hypothetical protein